MSAALPQAATIPPSFVCAKKFSKTLPPTVSTAPSHNPLSKGLVF